MDILQNDIPADKQELLLHDLIDSVQRALTTLLDPAETRDYRHAVEVAPALVASESRVVDFLRTEDYHTLRAAHRLALYWKYRREFFGPEQWLLPMTQTGAGALTPDAVQLLRCGAAAPIVDSDRAVCLSDRSRLPAGVTHILPTIFFYIHTVTTNVVMQTNSTIFMVVQQSGHAPLSKADNDVMAKLLACLPFRMTNLVVGKAFDPLQRNDQMARQEQKSSATRFGLGSKLVAGHSVRATVNALEERGLDRDVIPVALGGDFFYHLQFQDWIRQRLTVENAACYCAPPIRNSATANAVQRLALVRQVVDQQQQGGGLDIVTATTTTTTTTAAANDGSLSSLQQQQRITQQRPGESQQDFEKRRKSVYGQRSYYKKRSEQSQLQQRCQMLQSSNHALQVDNQRLEYLFQQAVQFVQTFHRSEDDDDVDYDDIW